MIFYLKKRTLASLWEMDGRGTIFQVWAWRELPPTEGQDGPARAQEEGKQAEATGQPAAGLLYLRVRHLGLQPELGSWGGGGHAL